jgi:hypothetical protein
MSKKYDRIIKTVDTAIDQMIETFEGNPELFFTENDIVCYFYNLCAKKLEEHKDIDTKNQRKRTIIHTEYPTPFKCNMRDSEFEIVKDNSIFRRGHYDVVILNPDFIARFNYNEIKAQNYQNFKNKILNSWYDNQTDEVILYGMEFMLSRDPLKSSRGNNKYKGIDNFIKKIEQDAKKLKESMKLSLEINVTKNFMKKSKMIVFVNSEGCDEQALEHLKYELSDFLNKNEIILVFSK